MKKLVYNILFISSLLLIISGCIKTEEDYVPKPKGYNRIDLPKAEYQAISEEHPYKFEFSKYAKVLKDTNGLIEAHWIHIYYPAFNSAIEITYKDLKDPKNNLSQLTNIAHKLTAKHQIKAYSISETPYMRSGDEKLAYLYSIDGEIPSPFQFYFTDSTNHFLRGAVYLPTSTQNDSLAPVIEFLKNDALHLINTLEWKK